jgi:hypothetical protein
MVIFLIGVPLTAISRLAAAKFALPLTFAYDSAIASASFA